MKGSNVYLLGKIGKKPNSRKILGKFPQNDKTSTKCDLIGSQH